MRQSRAEVSDYPQETCKISLKSSLLWHVELFLLTVYTSLMNGYFISFSAMVWEWNVPLQAYVLNAQSPAWGLGFLKALEPLGGMSWLVEVGSWGMGLLKVIPALVLPCPFSWPITIRGVSDTCSHQQELHPAFLSLMDESSYETMSPRKSSLLCFCHVYFQHDEKSFKRKKHPSCAAKTSSVFTSCWSLQTSCWPYCLSFLQLNMPSWGPW